jgi:PTH1 family peptidyl-tRNA hydrolase
MVVDELARRHDAANWKPKDGALQAQVAPLSLLLVKPQSFMNDSGNPIERVSAWWKIDPAAMLIVYDELDLPFGRLRMRASGSAGGHNGMKSVLQWLGTDDIARLRVGIGRGREAIDHVLAPFSAEEAIALERIIAAAADAVERWSREPFERAAEWANAWKDDVQ